MLLSTVNRNYFAEFRKSRLSKAKAEGVIFPALGTGHVFLLQVLIGLSCGYADSCPYDDISRHVKRA